MTQSEEISHDVHRFATERGVFCGSDPATAPRMPRQRRLPKGNLVSRFVALLYGLVSYLVFFVTFPYAIAFISNLVAPKTIDTGPVVPVEEALIVNHLLMSLFANQHSIMARANSSSNCGRASYRGRSNAALTYCSRASL